MRKTTRRPIAELVVAGLVGVGSPAIANGTDQETMSHVRSSDSSLIALIARATQQSATFRGLIDTINSSDGIVYVEAGRCRYSRTCLTGVSTAGEYRMLWVTIDTRRVDSELIASIGHELQHAVEILSNPGVRTTAAMYLFYSRFARRVGTGRGAFETEAATKIGNAVREEIRAFRSYCGSPSTRSGTNKFHRAAWRLGSDRLGVNGIIVMSRDWRRNSAHGV